MEPRVSGGVGGGEEESWDRVVRACTDQTRERDIEAAGVNSFVSVYINGRQKEEREQWEEGGEKGREGRRGGSRRGGREEKGESRMGAEEEGKRFKIHIWLLKQNSSHPLTFSPSHPHHRETRLSREWFWGWWIGN